MCLVCNPDLALRIEERTAPRYSANENRLLGPGYHPSSGGGILGGGLGTAAVGALAGAALGSKLGHHHKYKGGYGRYWKFDARLA